ncbi:hypothetical protein FBZ83_11967 [Azospirillum brasilense]|uniref:Uncharacterized protein n=1 Tax=Azospirillum brasilense TaxID=192 RepID=A0A560BUY1_AZOBR|nr:hypothetical protein FBZ83_11967 [Azospirillum brasilense]
MTINQARDLLSKHGICLTHEAVRVWCVRHGVGVRRGGRWDVLTDRLAAHVSMTVAELTEEARQ